MANSRMKDYYDVWMLVTSFDMKVDRMQQAIRATFARRETEVPLTVPEGLSAAFADDPTKQRQWQAFTRNLSGPVPALDRVVSDLRGKLEPYFG
jgi:hypothetical protein